jgi:hypothetical protein
VEKRYGDVVDELRVGALSITVKHSCIRRDVYDMTLGRAFPAGLRAALEPLGATRGGDALYVIDVEGVHQITVAAAAGRMVVMPKLATERADQRAAAIALAEQVSAIVER